MVSFQQKETEVAKHRHVQDNIFATRMSIYTENFDVYILRIIHLFLYLKTVHARNIKKRVMWSSHVVELFGRVMPLRGGGVGVG